MNETLTVHELTAPYSCGHCETGHHKRCLVVYRDAGLRQVKVPAKRDVVNVRVDVTCACAAADPDSHQVI